MVLWSILYFLCETSTWHLDRCRPEGTWYGVILWVLRVRGQGLNQSARTFFIRAFSGCYAILTSPKKGETAVYGYNPALFWVVSVSCWRLAEFIFTWYDQHCSILFAEFNMSSYHFCWSGLYRSYVLRHIRLRPFAVLCSPLWLMFVLEIKA